MYNSDVLILSEEGEDRYIVVCWGRGGCSVDLCFSEHLKSQLTCLSVSLGSLFPI